MAWYPQYQYIDWYWKLSVACGFFPIELLWKKILSQSNRLKEIFVYHFWDMKGPKWTNDQNVFISRLILMSFNTKETMWKWMKHFFKNQSNYITKCLLRKFKQWWSPISIDASYQVSLHLAEGFQRRRLKCEKLTDDKWWQKLIFPKLAFGKVS